MSLSMAELSIHEIGNPHESLNASILLGKISDAISLWVFTDGLKTGVQHMEDGGSFRNR
jgi:hypothetical protein